MFANLAIILISTTFTYAIDWNGNNWALWCDFYGNDLTNAQTRGEDCGGRCAACGTCWMKKNGASKSDAFAKYDSNAVCGVIASSSGSSTGGGSVPGVIRRDGHCTRYWDCCKPSCSWSGKASVTSPVATCSRDGYNILGDRNAPSGCGGGNAFTCNNNIPWAINNDLSYAFAAAHITGQSESDWCCACYEWTFTSGPIVGKKMIVQVTNSGDDLQENHFDLQIPGVVLAFSMDVLHSGALQTTDGVRVMVVSALNKNATNFLWKSGAGANEVSNGSKMLIIRHLVSSQLLVHRN